MPLLTYLPSLLQIAESNNSMMTGFGKVVNSMRPDWAYIFCCEMFCNRHNLFYTGMQTVCSPILRFTCDTRQYH